MDKESLKNQFKTWLYYKVSEFNDLGYTTIETEDLAHYLADYRWKQNLPENLFEQIFQINQLNINEYFDFESLEAQTNKEITLEDINLSELF